MNTQRRFMVFAAGGMVLMALATGAGSVLAQSSAAGSATLAVPAGYSVIPSNDSDRGDDQILQLNNLTIQNISNSVPGTLYASQDIGGNCREYMSVSGGTSTIYPCPLAPSVLYQISVQSDTILLLKNRSRAAITDFAVGDHINIFGFLDPGTSYVQALIMRNLDKPATAQYVQLNDLTVISAPDSSALPTWFRAARKGVESCLSFGSLNTARGIAFPCPLGRDIREAEPVPLPMTATTEAFTESTYYPGFRQYHDIQVTAATRLMNVSRQPIRIGDIQAGDQVNVYGRYIPGTRAVEALIVRDLSVPRVNGQPSIRVISPNGGEAWAVGQTKRITWSMQNIPSNAYLQLSLVDGPTSIYLKSLYPVSNVSSVDIALPDSGFWSDYGRELQPGNYKISATVYDKLPCLGLCPPDDPSYQAKIITQDSSDGYISISTSNIAPSISSIRPSSGTYGTKVTLRGKFARSGNYVYMSGYNAVNDLRSDGTTLTFTVPEYVGVCPYNPYDMPKEPMECITLALQLPVGRNPVHVINADGTSNSVNFTIESR